MPNFDKVKGKVPPPPPHIHTSSWEPYNNISKSAQFAIQLTLINP